MISLITFLKQQPQNPFTQAFKHDLGLQKGLNKALNEL